MREGKFSNQLGILLILTVFTLFLVNKAISKEYTVGDDEEWNSQANFLSWSEKYNFTVGDVLGMIFYFFPPFNPRMFCFISEESNRKFFVFPSCFFISDLSVMFV